MRSEHLQNFRLAGGVVILSAGIHAAALLWPMPPERLSPQAAMQAPKALRLTFAAPPPQPQPQPQQKPKIEKNARASLPQKEEAPQERKETVAAIPETPPSPQSDASETQRDQGETIAASPHAAPSNYLARLKEHLIPFRKYPEEARMWRLEGVATVRFRINGEGRVIRRRLKKSSGYRILDSEALALIRRAEPLPPPPLPRGQNDMSIIIPILFALR